MPATIIRRLGFTALVVAVTIGVSKSAVPQATEKPDGEKSKTHMQKEIEGWQVTVEKSLLEPDNEDGKLAITALANHLQRVKFIVPKKRLVQLQQIKIWLDDDYDELKSMQYHPSRWWLKNNGHQEGLAKHVHIPQSADLVDPKMWAKHPYVILHELSHAFHDQVLGFDHAEIKSCYQAARKSGKYLRVLAHDGREVVHYGLNDEKEYFAELTESYFGVNDFYPFVRAELKQHDPKAFELLEKIWGKIE